MFCVDCARQRNQLYSMQSVRRKGMKQMVMDELYGNNSLGGYQQRESPPEKEEHEKGLIEVITDKLRKWVRKNDTVHS